MKYIHATVAKNSISDLGAIAKYLGGILGSRTMCQKTGGSQCPNFHNGYKNISRNHKLKTLGQTQL